MTRRGVVEQPLLSNGSSTAKQEYCGFLFVVVGSSKKVAGWKCQEPTRTFSNLYAYTSQHSCWDLPFDAMNLCILCIARKNHFLYIDSWMLKQRAGSCLSSFPRYLGNTSTWNCCLLFDLAKHTAGSWTQTELVVELLH